jgi:hypothetical protein
MSPTYNREVSVFVGETQKDTICLLQINASRPGQFLILLVILAKSLKCSFTSSS